MPAGPVAYGWQCVLWLDQGLNVLCGGYSRETFSAHCWRRRNDMFWAIALRVVDRLFFFQKDHCKMQYEYEHIQYW